MNPITYIPIDGDFDPNRAAEYTKLINDIQIAAGYNLGAWYEISLSITIEGKDYANQLRIGIVTDPETGEYNSGYIYNFPPGYSREQLIDLLPGYVYLIPKPFTGRKS